MWVGLQVVQFREITLSECTKLTYELVGSFQNRVQVLIYKSCSRVCIIRTVTKFLVDNIKNLDGHSATKCCSQQLKPIRHVNAESTTHLSTRLSRIWSGMSSHEIRPVRLSETYTR